MQIRGMTFLVPLVGIFVAGLNPLFADIMFDVGSANGEFRDYSGAIDVISSDGPYFDQLDPQPGVIGLGAYGSGVGQFPFNEAQSSYGIQMSIRGSGTGVVTDSSLHVAITYIVERTLHSDVYPVINVGSTVALGFEEGGFQVGQAAVVVSFPSPYYLEYDIDMTEYLGWHFRSFSADFFAIATNVTEGDLISLTIPQGSLDLGAPRAAPAVPEPRTIAMILSALPGLCIWNIRKLIARTVK